MEWPRLSAFDDDSYLLDDVPNQLQKAVAEYALRAFIYGELAPDAPRAAPSQNLDDMASVVTGTSAGSGSIKSETKQAGELKLVQEFVSQAEIEQMLRDRQSNSNGMVSGVYIPQYPQADLWIAEIIDPAGSRRVARA